jgi:competence protein ComEA
METWKHRPWKEQVKDLLSLHAGERRGSVLLMLIMVLLMGWVVFEQWVRQPAEADLAAIEREMEAWLAEIRAKEVEVAVQADPFPFDPNILEREGWLALGLSERQVDGLERYTAKGGRFRVKSDLARMYTISPEAYQRLEPFIQLPDSLPRRERQAPQREQKKEWPERGAVIAGTSNTYPERTPRIAKVEVNTADSADLVALPGIGPAFARGILKYRESLGGYHGMHQLAEVYVLKDKPDALERMEQLLDVDPSMVRRIPINTCTVEELAAHPYIRWQLAKPLFAYRQQHGPFATVEDIRGCHLIDEEVFRKLAPYLTVE